MFAFIVHWGGFFIISNFQQILNFFSPLPPCGVSETLESKISVGLFWKQLYLYIEYVPRNFFNLFDMWEIK